MKKKIIGILVCILFFGTSFLPIISGSIEQEDETPNMRNNQSTQSFTIDWWSMYRHDLYHTGYSTSTGPNTNATLWNYTTGNDVLPSPTVVDGRVYIGSYDDKVYCLDAINGSKIWDYTTGFWVFSSPAVADGRVYIGSEDDKVYCLDAINGSKIWEYITGSNAGSSPAVADGKVYTGSYDGKVYCLDAVSGSEIWNYTTGDSLGSSPAVVDGRVYIGSDDDRVYCLNAVSGSKIWDYTTGDDVMSSPAVASGKVYIGSFDSKVYCLDAINGSKIWDYTTGARVWTSPTVADGKLYIGSDDNKVYCFGSENQPPSAPTIDGPNSGKPKTSYDFIFNAVDTDGDNVRYIINWGDNTSNITGPIPSGNNVTVSHTWNAKGTYTISAKAEDEYGLIGPKATKEITIPRNKALLTTQPILQWLFERFPILRHLLGL
jgi:outer membrane protein assembly factor BamB